MSQVEKKLDEQSEFGEKLNNLTPILAELKTDIAVIKTDITYLKKGA